MENKENNHIESLLSRIEENLKWGDSAQWSSYDFDKLTELIFERTKVSVSSNTLKRVWGRIKYESKPSDMTLNTLSQFLGHKDFREFISSTDVKGLAEIEQSKARVWFKWPPFQSRPSTIFVSGAIFMLVAIIALSYTSKEQKYNPDDFYFTSRKVTKGLPNSVVFEYRAKNARENAKVEIQQSWDKSKRMDISREDSLVTSIYFDPGYFNAKLMVDGQTVKEHGVLIPSLGWKAKVKSDERTVYFRDSTVAGSGRVAVAPQLLADNGIARNGNSLNTYFRYVDDFNDLRANDLLIETTFRNTSDTSQNPCRNSFLTLLMEGEVIKIPFSNLGCVAELEGWHIDEAISGRNNDLSKLGVDFDDWVMVSFIIKKDWMTVNINGNKSLELPMKGRLNKFHGLIYSFEGTGEIKSLSLNNSRKTYLEWPKLKSKDIL